MSFPRIGLISDTHGLLRPQALVALEGCQVILHAGDVGDVSILEALSAIAPTHAVAGNCDDLPELPWELLHRMAGMDILLRHGHLPTSPSTPSAQVVVTGHTHVPDFSRDAAGVLHLNPGSAGPRRFRLPVTVALLHLLPGGPEPELVELDVR